MRAFLYMCRSSTILILALIIAMSFSAYFLLDRLHSDALRLEDLLCFITRIVYTMRWRCYEDVTSNFLSTSSHKQSNISGFIGSLCIFWDNKTKTIGFVYCIRVKIVYITNKKAKTNKKVVGMIYVKSSLRS